MDVKYVTRKQVAEALQCSAGLVYKMTIQGRIPAIRVGADLRYNISDVITALKNESEANSRKPQKQEA